MRNLRGTYVHRGDALRRQQRFRQALVLAGFAAACVLVVKYRKAPSAAAEPAGVDRPGAEAATSGFHFDIGQAEGLRTQLENTQGELDLMRSQYERANKIIHLSARFKVPADLAGSIFDVALAEGIDPELAFRLVQLESDFNDKATSPKGAIGLTQIMLGTARYFAAGVTREGLYDRKTNLRVGFRYLRALANQYNGNMKLALLVYNRGEVAVNEAIHAGENPTNGYDRQVMRGYKGKGVIN